MSFPPSGSKPSRRLATEAGSLYFAYGSNLHLTQMANRCPASVFKGKAVLSGYRWQINQRGVANVVQSIDDSVEGLLYLVNSKDERSLDRSEGVAKGFYQKHLLTVAFEPHSQFENRESFEVAQSISQSANAKRTAGFSLTDRDTDKSDPAQARRQGEPNGTEKVKALVYVSENYTNDGIIREEYILRVQKAMFDAQHLGVSRSFVDRYVTPFLDQRNEVLSAPSHAEGEGHALRSRSDNGLTETPSEHMNVFETHETQISGETQSHFPEGNNDSLGLVDLQQLEHANRDTHSASSLELPPDMLDAINSARSEAKRDGHRMAYIVVAHEGNADSTPSFDVLAASLDLGLVNELAIERFRNACSRSFPSIMAEAREHWVKSDSVDSQSGLLNWKFDEHACIQLDATVPDRGRITIRVYAQRLSARI